MRTKEEYYEDTLKKVFNMIFIGLVMVIVLLVVKIFIPFNSMNRVLSIFLVAFYALLGAIIYFGLMFKTGMIYDVFGRGNVEKILAKLKIKRRG